LLGSGQLSEGKKSEVLAAVPIKTLFWNKLLCGLVRVTHVSENEIDSLFDPEDGGSAPL
jgi:hypothetical protein